MYQNKKLVAPTHCHKGAHHRSTQWPLFLKVRKNFRLINFFSKRRRRRWSFVGLCPLLLLPYFYRPIRNTCYQFFRQIYFYSYQAQAGIQIREGRQRRSLWNSPSGEQQCFSYTAACKISLATQSIYFLRTHLFLQLWSFSYNNLAFLTSNVDCWELQFVVINSR